MQFLAILFYLVHKWLNQKYATGPVSIIVDILSTITSRSEFLLTKASNYVIGILVND